MASLGGEFAGIVQLQVPKGQKAALNQALLDLQSTGLRIVSSAREAAASAPRRGVSIELLGADRPGLVSELASMLAARSVSIESLGTECVAPDKPGETIFKVRAHVQVPAQVSLDELRAELGSLARKLMMDIALS